MKKIHIRTLGCPKNEVDSEIIAGLTEKNQFIITQLIEDSDITIINTCGFIEPAKIESIDEILYALDLKKKGVLKKVYVFGCLVQRYKKELERELPEVDKFFGVSRFDELYFELTGEQLPSGNSFLLRKNYSHYAYLKISEGCSNFCTYCTIPFIKGMYKSRPENDILNEVEILDSRGVKELIIISQDTGRYGKDEICDLFKLLEKINKFENIKWIRILYMHPVHINQDFTEIFKIDKVIPYLDMPVQHSSTKILEKMNRGYTEKELRKKIDILRKNIDNIVLRSSIIVGFPGEKNEDFENLYNFINDVRFDYLGIFKYYREEGTRAFDMKFQIPDDIKSYREEELSKLQNEISFEKGQRLIGRNLDVIIDEYMEEENLFVGRTYRDAPEIDGIVKVFRDDLKIGNIYNLKVKDVKYFEFEAI